MSCSGTGDARAGCEPDEFVGRRATGTAGASFLLTDRDDQGEVPDGMTVVPAPTGVFSILGRMLVKA